MSQSPWSNWFSLIFPSSLPIFPPFFPPLKRWPDPSAPAGADESPRSDPALGAPLPGPRESMGKNEEKNMKKPEKLWKNLMKWQWTEETRRNIRDLFNTLALFEMSKIPGEVWKSSHSDYLNPISKHWSTIDKIIINNHKYIIIINHSLHDLMATSCHIW